MKGILGRMANFRQMYKLVLYADQELKSLPRKDYVKYLSGDKPRLSQKKFAKKYAKTHHKAEDRVNVVLSESVKRGYLSSSSVVGEDDNYIWRGTNYHDFTEKRGFFKYGYWRLFLAENSGYVIVGIAIATGAIVGNIVIIIKWAINLF